MGSTPGGTRCRRRTESVGRIDHSTSQALQSNLAEAAIMDVMGSDHCPVSTTLDGVSPCSQPRLYGYEASCRRRNVNIPVPNRARKRRLPDRLTHTREYPYDTPANHRIDRASAPGWLILLAAGTGPTTARRSICSASGSDRMAGAADRRAVSTHRIRRTSTAPRATCEVGVPDRRSGTNRSRRPLQPRPDAAQRSASRPPPPRDRRCCARVG